MPLCQDWQQELIGQVIKMIIRLIKADSSLNQDKLDSQTIQWSLQIIDGEIYLIIFMILNILTLYCIKIDYLSEHYYQNWLFLIFLLPNFLLLLYEM